jgi:alpha-galactosidase
MMKISKRFFWIFLINILFLSPAISQNKLPPMGWMSWNLYGTNINEAIIKDAADYMVESGLSKVGFTYVCIDDGWQGGRDNRNNIIPDPVKFPSGIKALADYVHSKGLKLGIYSDAAQLTCEKYTASFGFEAQDARTFALWGVDYLKYDYCNAPVDKATAIERYTTMSNALKNTGRDIVFAICEWGMREPWLWASKAGGNVWRTTWDTRDVWESTKFDDTYNGLLNIYDVNIELSDYVTPNHLNDPDMLVVGLYGKGLASSIRPESKVGCTDIEYQSNMSLWCLMAAPLMISCDLKNMNQSTKSILLNKEIIAINQDSICKQAKRIIHNRDYDVLIKPLTNGDYAVGILNRSNTQATLAINFKHLGIEDKFKVRNVWLHTQTKNPIDSWKGVVKPHETIVLRLMK